jgi:nitrogen regulatory protein P-II 1
MKEIKAYIRTNVVERTVAALEAAGAPGITVTRVHPVGYGFDPNYFAGTEDIAKLYPAMAKVEVVCTNEDVDRLVAVISEKARTGFKGDGMVFVSPVEEAVKIRTGEKGEVGL